MRRVASVGCCYRRNLLLRPGILASVAPGTQIGPQFRGLRTIVGSMIRPRQALEGAVSYLARNPEALLHAAKNVTKLRIGVPLAALRWLAAQVKGKKAPSDIVVEAVPPGVRVACTVDIKGTPARAGVTLFVDEVSLNSSELRFAFRLTDVSVELPKHSDSPLKALWESGSLDLSRPGDLLKFLSKRPPMVIDAEGDAIVIDLMKHPAIAKNPKALAIIGMITPFVTVKGVQTDSGHVDILLSVLEQGLGTALSGLNSHL